MKQALAAAALIAAAPAAAQDPAMDHMHMPMATPPADPAVPAPGDTPAPAPPSSYYADRYWDPAEMARARAVMMQRDGGGRTFAQVMIDRLELVSRAGRDGYRWDGAGWFGGDIDRIVVKSEGEGAFRRRAETAEVSALYSRAVDPYFNLQAGIRQDLQPGDGRTYAAIGVEGLAPYWFDVAATAFLSTGGDLRGRIEGYYDQRLTQRLILQPRAEINLGSGASAELGLRLRYELKRELAPYVGISWERATGGDTGLNAVFGVRAWF